jgi:hypothetical protein
LSGINNVGLPVGQFSTYTYTTTLENFISGITETSDATAIDPLPARRPRPTTPSASSPTCRARR